MSAAPQPPSIQWQGVHRSFTATGTGVRRNTDEVVRALDGIDLEVRGGETLCLIGPSGCGKTTLLKVLNRLVDLDAGRVLVGGVDTAGMDPIELRRGMGYVVQSGALFPHLTVAANIGVLWEVCGWETERKEARLKELLDLVGLPAERFGERFGHELSGGQRQRVGIARALALDPAILLMDEPFGALDRITRRELQNEFLGLSGRLGKTLVIVTHDLEEAFRLGQRVAILRKGRLEQVGTPDELRSAPASPFVESFVREQFVAGH